MDYIALAAEVNTDPELKGYASFLPHGPGHVVRLLNEYTEMAIKPRRITARAILAECPAGGTILDKLEAASASSSSVKWAVKFLGQEAGVDVGMSATQTMIDQLVVGGVLTTAEGDQLKNLAKQKASRAEVLGFGYVTEQDLTLAGI